MRRPYPSSSFPVAAALALALTSSASFVRGPGAVDARDGASTTRVAQAAGTTTGHSSSTQHGAGNGAARDEGSAGASATSGN